MSGKTVNIQPPAPDSDKPEARDERPDAGAQRASQALFFGRDRRTRPRGTGIPAGRTSANVSGFVDSLSTQVSPATFIYCLPPT